MDKENKTSTKDISIKERISKARESRTTLRQIDKLEKEIASMEIKISRKKERMVELAKKL